MNATATTASGTKVTTKDGITGTTVGTPALTPSGYVVSVEFDAEFAHLSPVGGADYSVEDLTVAETTEAPAAGRQLRASQGESAVGGAWELLYNKPRQSAQVVRDRGQYALVCTKHLTVHRLPSLTAERAVRKAGAWCPDCQH